MNGRLEFYKNDKQHVTTRVYLFAFIIINYFKQQKQFLDYLRKTAEGGREFINRKMKKKPLHFG